MVELIPPELDNMTEQFYIAVKGSLYASDSSVFGLTPEEVTALTKRYPDSNKIVVNGVLIKASPLRIINSLGELGYRVVCSSGEAEIVWTLRRDCLTSPFLPEQPSYASPGSEGDSRG